jgi:hypothetical protein
MGHFCRICGRSRPNENFSGRRHRDHVCKDCQRMPREQRDRIERLDELHGFLHQSQSIIQAPKDRPKGSFTEWRNPVRIRPA